MDVVLEKGHGKDGSPSHPYVHHHRTNYDWRKGESRLNIADLTHRNQMMGNDHQDPGPRFPWKAYMKRVREFAEG